MDDKKFQSKPDPQKLEAFRSLPKYVLESLSKDEIQAFLREDVWPDSLKIKLKGYLVEEEK